jgi:outer membrane biosynthesis protein TonB
MAVNSAGRTRSAVVVCHVVAVAALVLWGTLFSSNPHMVSLIRVGLVEVPQLRPAEVQAPVETQETSRPEPIAEAAVPVPVTPRPADPVPVETVRETPPRPVEPKWQARSVEEIRRGAKLTRPSPSPAPAPPSSTVKASDIAARLSRNVRNVRSEVAIGSTAGSQASGGETSDFLAMVTAQLYGAWEQPSRSVVGSRRPTVTAQLTIVRDGRVVKAVITGGSGIDLMDESVRRALGKVVRVAPFEKYGMRGSQLTVAVNFELD